MQPPMARVQRDAKRQQMRVSLSASDFTCWLATGLPDEISLYTKVGAQAKHAGAHVAALVKAACDDPLVTAFITDGTLPAHLGDDFAKLGARVINLGTAAHRHNDDHVRRAPFGFDPSSLLTVRFAASSDAVRMLCTRSPVDHPCAAHSAT